MGAEYLEIAHDQTPAIADRRDSFRLNDKLGSPRVCPYGRYGDFSPTTLRYVKVRSANARGACRSSTSLGWSSRRPAAI
jgi:hypothetical protein